MIRVAVVGATGYTGLELIKILLRHPNVEIVRLTSRDPEMPHLSKVHPSLRDQLDLNLVALDVEDIAANCDAVFCCLPHAASAEIIRQLMEHELKIVDFSADYRHTDVETFETWYKVKHPDPERIGTVAYGIPELFREQIREAKLVANPGCFPSSAVLPLAPLLAGEPQIKTSPIIVDSKTGISGAGRKANLKFHFPECNESVAAYGIGTHRHMPEIDSVIKRFADQSIQAIFTPHLIPMDRGILSTIYVHPAAGVTVESASDALREFYAEQPFVRIVAEPPKTKDVSGTNFCDISIHANRDMLIVVSALDNLIKGASGAAVQNFNLMFGLEETLALI